MKWQIINGFARGKKLLVFISLIIILVAAITIIDRKDANPSRESHGAGIKVKVLRVEEQQLSEKTQVTATVIPYERVNLAAKVMAHVREINVKEGDSFSAGQVLARLDKREIATRTSMAEAGLEQASKAVSAAEAGLREIAAARQAAEASLNNARSTYERTEKLYQAGAASKQDYDNAIEHYKAARAQVERLDAQEQALLAQRQQALAKVKEAQAGLAAANIQMGYTEINAPFTGVVFKKMVEVGDLVGPGQPLLVVDRPPWRVEAALNEQYLPRIHVGDTLKIEVDNLAGQQFVGKVAEINPAVDPMSRTFKIKIDLPDNGGIKPGMFARVYLPIGQRQGIVLPETAIVKKYDLNGVFVVGEDGKAHLRYVEVGRKVDGGQEITGGLKPGEMVVTGGLEGLEDGLPVEVE
ncbi:MAG: efflux RND transporter periplasmic adaptor subunit [Moorella sp. (in: firmicutes)]